MKKLTTNIFIEKSKQIHGNTYDYSLVDYKNNRTKVKIICPKHGIFEQTPNSHINGQNCKKCSIKNLGKNKFINKSKKIHNNKYDYSLVDYENNKTKVKIICPKHGIFEQRPDSHLRGLGCNKCGIDNKKNKLKIKDFINRSKNVHGNTYDYSLVDYKNNRTKVKIICPKHGMFEQKPFNHYKGMGCNICNYSVGETIINNYLIDNNIKFIKEKSFNKCRNILPLRFDFYLIEHNLCVEFNGKQHYFPYYFFGGVNYLKKLKINDKIKINFCKENNINLLIIKYNENIKEKLELYLKNKKIYYDKNS
jgi:hypothetical protein